ncbi:MAG: hypothetical protein DRI69_11725 [Bacteroidetes bacterium]|nr:MAG: hypothetical protein DRI69_11725 [Bacteroidota bacterium]
MPRKADNWAAEGKGHWDMKDNVLEITENSINRDPFTAPSARIIYDKSTFTSFELTVEMKSNAPLSEIRGDMIIIFGYQSPTQYYYAHLTGTVDSIHNGVFIVDNTDRRKVDFTEFEPVLIDREWHKIRLVRDTEAGSIGIFRDGDEAPMISVYDKTFLEGKIGFGSFNDTGEIRSINITSYN